MTADLAERRGWRRIVLVTSRFHLVRAERLFERCSDVEIVVRGSPEPWWVHIKAIPSEWAKFAVAETARRGC